MIHKEIQIDVPPDIVQDWQEIVNMLAGIVGIPAALIMRLNEPYIEVFVSSKSDGNPYHPEEKEIFYNSGLYCETVIKSNEKLLVPDALVDENWKNNPDIKLGMVSYLGFPILLPDGSPFGTICILDKKHNAYSMTVEDLMLTLKNLIQSHLELIYMNQVLGDRNNRLSDYLMELQTLRGIVPICAHCKSVRDSEGNWHPIEHYLIKHPEADFSHTLCQKCARELYPEYQ